MCARFRDDYTEKIKRLKSAPEFQDCVRYESIIELLDPSVCVVTSLASSPNGTAKRERKFSGSITGTLAASLRSVSKRSNEKVQQTAMQVVDWQRTIEAKIFEETERVRKNLAIVEVRLEESTSFISALQTKAREGSTFASGDMRQLLKLQKERDRLSMDLDEYKSLNFRALMKILNAYHENGGFDAYKVLLPQVLEELESRPLSPKPRGHRGWSQKLDNFFTSATMDLGEEERSFFLESRDMIINQCMEVLDHPQAAFAESTTSPASSRASEQPPPMWHRLAPPVVKLLLTEYKLAHFSRDVVAAVVISVAGIPKAMSYAALADLPVTAGIATLYMPALVYALLGSSRQVAISPQSVTCLLLGQMVAETLKGTPYEGDPAQQLGLAMTLTLYTGLVVSLFGALNLCFLLNFISKSVLSGFISASAIIAAVSTVKSLLALHVKKSPILYILIQRMVAELGNIHGPTALISFAGIMLLFVMPPLQKRAAKKLKGNDRALARGAHFVVKIPSVLCLMALGLVLGAILCRFEPFTEWKLEHLVAGRGATAPALYFERVNERFACTHYVDKVASQYHPTSSGDGLKIGTSNSSVPVHFSATDMLPPDAPDVLALPLSSTFVCAVVHIPFLSSTEQISLVLDVPTVAAIFAGEVQEWTHPKIRLANPNLPWDSLGESPKITVVVRVGDSGTTAAFASGLLSCADCNASLWTPGLAVDWGAPRLVAVKGNRGVVATVALTPWSIGYATWPAVKDAADPHARCLAWKVGGEHVVTTSLAWGFPAANPWPVPLTSYVLVSRPHASSCSERAWLKKYFEVLYSHEEVAREFSYQLLPRPDGLDTIPCEGAGAGRRLAAAGGDSGDFTCSLPPPKCNDIKVVGYIDASMPRPTIPDTQVQFDFGSKIKYALMLAAVALLEHVANVKLYADREGYSVSMSMDLVAVGLANIVGSLFGSFVVAGGFSRSALNEKAASQMSLLLSVIVSFAVVFAISSLLSMLPDAVLNIILFCAVVPLVDFRTVLALARLGRRGFADLLALVVAFIATCFLGVVQGMLLAIMVSLVEFVWNSVFPQISQLQRAPGSLHYDPGDGDDNETTHIIRDLLAFRRPRLRAGAVKVNDSSLSAVKVFRFAAPLWFANAATLSDLLLSELRCPALQGIVLDMSTVPWMDNTAANILKKVLDVAQERRVMVVFASVTTDVGYFLENVCRVHKEQLVKTLYAAEMAVRAGSPSLMSSDASPQSARDVEQTMVMRIDDSAADTGFVVPKKRPKRGPREQTPEQRQGRGQEQEQAEEEECRVVP